MPGVAGTNQGDNGERDNLALLFGGLDPNSPLAAAMMPGGAPGVSPVTPPPAAAPPTGPAAALRDSGAMPPSGVMPMPQNPPIAPVMSAIPRAPQALLDKITAAKTPVDRSQYQPHWWERLEGALIGAGAGFHGGAAGGQLGADWTNRRYERAEGARERNLAPLLEQQRQYEQAAGPVEKENEEKNISYHNQASNYDQLMRAYELNASKGDVQAGAVPRIDNTDPDNPKFMYKRRSGEEFEGPPPAGYENNARRSEEDKNTPATGARPERYIDPQTKAAAWRVKTKAGGWMPYEPKSIEEGAMMGNPTALELYNKAHPGKDGTDKRGTRNQFVNAQTKRDTAWTKAKSEYDEQVSRLSPKDKEGLTRAQQDYYDARQEAQNSFEDNIDTLGGQADHLELPRNHFGEAPGAAAAKPAAAPPAAAKPAARKEGDVVRLKGVGPVRITKMHSDGKTFAYVKAGQAGQ